MAWDDAKKAKAVELYMAAEPTPETTMGVLEEVAEELGETVNGVRMILTKAKREDGSPVYVKKEAAAAGSSSGAKKAASGGGSTRVSKEDSHKALIESIEALGQSADSEIISKMTGKAAQYFTAIFTALKTA